MGAGELWQRSGEELLCALAEVEGRIRREYAASLELIAELDVRNVAAETGYPNLALLLRDLLRISTREARRRLGHVAAVVEAPAVSGGVVPAGLPVAAAALREGVLGPEHVDAIGAALRDLPLHVPDTDRDLAERTLVDAARELDPGRLRRVGDRVRAWLDEDGAAPTDRELAEPVNELHLTTRANGRTAFHGELDQESSAILLAAVSALAKPRPTSTNGPDPRSAAERQGDAFADILRLATDTGLLPSEAGEKPHLLVTVPLDVLRSAGHAALDVLRAGTGHATLDGVGRLDIESARRLACDAKVIPAVLGSRSEPLDLGRASYTVSTAVRRALVLRDQGCAFPGCDRTHRWCHSHHIHHWADGGATTPDNLVLLCGQHHRLIHHSAWECSITNGHAEFRPPAFLDPTQNPRRNTMHKIPSAMIRTPESILI